MLKIDNDFGFAVKTWKDKDLRLMLTKKSSENGVSHQLKISENDDINF